MKAYILAEIASSHCGDKNTLYELIYAAARSRADGVKLQVWRKNEIKNHPRYENLKKFQISRKVWMQAAEMIKRLNMDLWCEIYGVNSLKMAKRMDYDYLKVKKSTVNKDCLFAGMMAMEDNSKIGYNSIFWRFEKELDALPHNLCVGEQNYPTSPDAGRKEVDICNQLSEQDFNVLYADHQKADTDEAFTIPLSAYQAGADIIEKHICIDRKELSQYSNDYYSALEPKEFENFVDFMKNQTKVSCLL